MDDWIYTDHLRRFEGYDSKERRINMADFFENLEKFGKKIIDKAEVVTEEITKKTEEAVEVQKIKSQMRVMERNNERDYKDIGKMIYDRYKSGEVVDAQFLELCEAIEERDEEIAKAKREIAEIKGLDVCQNCKAHVEPGAAFCPSCGTKIDNSIFEDEEE